MIDTELKSRLTEFLAEHGKVQSLTSFPGARPDEPCMILVTMEHPQDATRLYQKFGFQPFGFNSLIISATWLESHLI